MKNWQPGAVLGRVGSLHLHPKVAGDTMRPVASIEAVEGMGIRGNDRYYDRRQRATAEPSHRQISLIEREQIAQHAQALGMDQIPPGAVRANIETIGVNLVELVGKRIQIGAAMILIREPRTPCAKMDSICKGLRARMEDNQQGVLAQVVGTGLIAQGDPIVLVPESATSPTPLNSEL